MEYKKNKEFWIDKDHNKLNPAICARNIGKTEEKPLRIAV